MLTDSATCGHYKWCACILAQLLLLQCSSERVADHLRASRMVAGWRWRWRWRRRWRCCCCCRCRHYRRLWTKRRRQGGYRCQGCCPLLLILLLLLLLRLPLLLRLLLPAVPPPLAMTASTGRIALPRLLPLLLPLLLRLLYLLLVLLLLMLLPLPLLQLGWLAAAAAAPLPPAA